MPFVLALPHPLARRVLTPLTLAALLAGCQALPSSEPGMLPEDDPMASAPPIQRGLDAQGLAGLMTAEIAGQRGEYRRATQGYLEGAERYDSVQLIERAALAARFSNDAQLLADTAQRWQDMAPESDEPARLLASLAVQQGDWSAALDQRLRLVDLGGQGELVAFIESALAEGADPAPLLERMHAHLATRDATASPEAHDAELATAMLEVAIGDNASASRRLERLAQLSPELPALWLTRAQLAQQAGDHTGARDAARRGLAVAPGDARFILLLAQSELRLGNVAAAETQTDALLDEHSGDEGLRLALAQLYVDEGLPEPARRLLLPLIGETDTPPLTFYMLGAIAESQGETDNALLYYRQVTAGEEFMPARLRAASMLIDDDRLADARTFLRIERLRHDDAFTDLISLEVELLDQQGLADQADALIDQELSRTPNDEQLLYLRAMRAFNAGDVEAMERDLERIIERNPDSAAALNALGYTLAALGREARFEEARTMIERAHELEPDNPAILDSMGWIRFRQGDTEQALPWLQRAWAAMPDQEVAAHLIEVLWALEQRDEARELLRMALQRFEERPALEALLKRLPELSPAPR